MLKQEGLPPTGPTLSFSQVLGVLYPGRESSVSTAKNLFADQKFRSNRETAIGPDAIWGHYNNYRSNGLAGSVVVHVVIIGLILFGASYSPKVIPLIKPQENVVLIAPSPDSYALPVATKIASGGGGGGEHDRLTAPKGRLPKPAMQQITDCRPQ
jgi:hypothetical protein